MTLHATEWLQALGALLAVLGLAWLGARLVRQSPLAQRSGRRMAVLEALSLDPRRRLVVVRVDGRELLLLTGGGQDAVVGWLPESQG